MEEIAFKNDEILSDVHLHMQREKCLAIRVNAAGQPVFQSHFTILWRNEDLDIPCNEIQQNKETAISFEKHTSDDFIFGHGLCTSSLLEKGVPVDDDGDLVVSRRLNTKEEHNCSRDVVFPTILTIQNGNGEDYYQRNEVVKIGEKNHEIRKFI
ncbi:methyltransferase 22 [Pelobates cultripes]|uniref:Methyltransferase 22 n=1 Tax=Pelobates cultripes TaxID=61616 RepID=A0AAD1WF26_PELCU|nr:methyltransferase 22 [Pelobates cultripes]